MKGYFTKDELEETLKSELNINNKIFIRNLVNIILTYSYVLNISAKDIGHKFLRVKKDLENNEEKYILVSGNFRKFRTDILRSFMEIFESRKEDNIFIKYVSKESRFLEVATLIQALELGSFEVTGGNTPKIFFRVNDPTKLEYLSKNNTYTNSILSNIEKIGKKADIILEEFFSSDMNNVERWNYIENYFLGRI